MKKMIAVLKKNNGYARTGDLKSAGINSRKIVKALDAGLIEKIKTGFYKLADYEWSEFDSLLDVCNADDKVVISLLSALTYYGLSTFNPSDVYLTIPEKSAPPKILFPPVRIFYSSEKIYHIGIELIQLKKGVLRIYDREKTICDMFRYRHKLGDDVAIEGLKNYMMSRGKNINKLMKYAEICRIKSVISPFIAGMV